MRYPSGSSGRPARSDTIFSTSARPNRRFIDSAPEALLTNTYRKFTAETDDFEPIAMAGKLKVLQENLGGDLNRLAAIFYQICSNDRRYRDFTRRDVEDVLRTTLGCMNVYRTYLRLNS